MWPNGNRTIAQSTIRCCGRPQVCNNVASGLWLACLVSAAREAVGHGPRHTGGTGAEGPGLRVGHRSDGGRQRTPTHVLHEY
jgi:hypothetical protein